MNPNGASSVSVQTSSSLIVWASAQTAVSWVLKLIKYLVDEESPLFNHTLTEAMQTVLRVSPADGDGVFVSETELRLHK